MPSPTDRIKIIQVGAGAMGRLWLDVLAGSADVELVGLVDIDLSAAQLSAAGAGLPDVALARSLPELLDLVAADAVLNVTVPEAHAEVSITALLHGLRGAVRETPRRHPGRSTVYDRCRRGRRSAADGLPVPAVLA